MTEYDPPEPEELFTAWFDQVSRQDPEADRDAMREAFNAGIDEIRADALHTASLASAGGTPMKMRIPDWLNVQASLYSDRIFRTEETPVEHGPHRQQMITIPRPQIESEHRSFDDTEISQLLLGASCWIRDSSLFGSNLRATVAKALWQAGQALWTNRYSAGYGWRIDTETITFPRPTVPHGPVDIPVEIADADYLNTAARKIAEFYKPFTPEVRELVAQLLRDAAYSIAALVPAQDSAQ